MPIDKHLANQLQASQALAKQRSALMQQSPVCIWLTGLSGSGKSTLALALERVLLDMGEFVYVLDGDSVRRGLCKDLGFSAKDRCENIRRVAEVAHLLNEAGLIVVTAFISPYVTDRAMARDIIGADRFREVYISTPLEVCESRDPKGLYKKARAGLIPDFTGISAPYEPPAMPDASVDTAHSRLEQSVSVILRALKLS